MAKRRIPRESWSAIAGTTRRRSSRSFRLATASRTPRSRIRTSASPGARARVSDVHFTDAQHGQGEGVRGAAQVLPRRSGAASGSDGPAAASRLHPCGSSPGQEQAVSRAFWRPSTLLLVGPIAMPGRSPPVPVRYSSDRRPATFACAVSRSRLGREADRGSKGLHKTRGARACRAGRFWAGSVRF